jgi:uncharacterized membrane protein YeaQ/YmgE (transglycosylase-associated protein family)
VSGFPLTREEAAEVEGEGWLGAIVGGLIGIFVATVIVTVVSGIAHPSDFNDEAVAHQRNEDIKGWAGTLGVIGAISGGFSPL